MRKAFEFKNLVKIAILAAVAAVLMTFKFPLPFAPSFMTVDFSDVVGLVGGFALGPISGILIAGLKNLLNLIINGTMTFGIGEISNFIVSATFIGIASLIYDRKKSFKRAILGMVFGSLAMTSLAIMSNAFVIFPMYAAAMGQNLDFFVKGAQAINGLVSSYWTLMFFSIAPFNIVKSFMVSLITCLIYKRVSPLLKSESKNKEETQAVGYRR